jgi:hypothetical protein
MCGMALGQAACKVFSPYWYIPLEDLDESNQLATGEKPMVAANPNYRFPSAASHPVPPVHWLAVRVRHYFKRHPEVSWDEFLLDAVRREITFREQEDGENGPWHARPEGQGTGLWSAGRPPRTEADIRIHAWLHERLAALHRERHGLWPKLRRFLFGHRLVRWLALERRPWLTWPANLNGRNKL